MREGIPNPAESFSIQSDPGKVVALDEFLEAMVKATHTACNTGQAHIKDTDPTIADKALRDSTEFVMKIMAGDVEEWIG